MKATFTFFTLMLIAFFIFSCATIKHGSKQSIHINSIPQGAEVRINDSLMGVTPFEIKVKRIKQLTLTYTHADFETRVYEVPRTFNRKRLIKDMPFWFVGFNPFLFTDLLTGAAFEFDQNKLNPDLADASLFTSLRTPLILTATDSIEMAKQEAIKKVTRDSVHKAKAEQRAEELRLARANALAERRINKTRDSITAIEKRELKTRTIEKKMSLRSSLKNSLYIHPFSLLTSTVHLSYTRYIGKQLGLGIELGYKPKSTTSKNFQNNNTLNINGPVDAIMFMPFAEGKYACLFTKIYTDKKFPINMFVTAAVFYRSYEYTNATITWEDAVGGSKGLVHYYHDNLDAYQTHQGVKLLCGVNPIFQLGNGIALELETSVGFSIRNISTSLYHYNYYYETNSSNSSVSTGRTSILKNQEEKYDAISQVSPLLNFKIGLRF